jgi:hypothetical protein
VVADIRSIIAIDIAEETICSTPHAAEPTRHNRANLSLPLSSHEAGTRSPTTRLGSGFEVKAETMNTAPITSVTSAGAIR